MGPAGVALRAGRRGASLTELGAQVIEGWRVSETPGALTYDPRAETTPIYRQSNLGRLRLHLGPSHWATPSMTEHWCIQPGDVVLNKLGPVRAALVPPAARRHPVDGNSLIVRGLPLPAAAWLAVCLNQSAYEDLLVIESGILRRVGVKTLLGLRLPPVPGEMGAAAQTLVEVADELLLAGEALERLKGEATSATEASLSVRDLREGAFFPAASMSAVNWLPSTVSMRADHDYLAGLLAWMPIGSVATAAERVRLEVAPVGARVLRLGDVGDDLFVGAATPEVLAADMPVGRVLRTPLLPGEVLVSTLGSSFRVAYVDDGVDRTMFPTDGWGRLRFRETPAAWALLLSTPQARQQAARLAIGTVQQFVPADALLSIHLPVPERDLRDRWQRTLERHLALRRRLEVRWAEIVAAMGRLYEAAHEIVGSGGPRFQEARA